MNINIKLNEKTTLSRIEELEKALNRDFSDVVADYSLEASA